MRALSPSQETGKRRTLYIPDGFEGAWEQAARKARGQHISLSRLVAEYLAWYIKHDG